ncbi:MAG: methylthioribose-1-phosphate isomerase [Oleiphilaceae bacterium]|jgi:methylthioribose-1-phosphate isomerase
MINRRHVHAVEWHGDQLVLLDQRKLPIEEVYVICQTLDDAIEAIKNMTVRGAPAIGIAAAYASVLCVKNLLDETDQCERHTLQIRMLKDLEQLRLARPTAVNLAWAVNQAIKIINDLDIPIIDLPHNLLLLAETIHKEDVLNNQHMAELGCKYIKKMTSVTFSMMTHCNAGSLATGGYGTALGVVRLAWQKDLIDKVYANETRPWLQGSRLTAWELQYEGIPVSLNVDSASAWIMSNRNVKWVVVGADRIAANGDVANKIGTYQLAITAKFHDVKFMVVAPSSTVDLTIDTGESIDIEMRDGSELTHYQEHSIAPQDIETVNPVFDVTPAYLIDVIVTEKGIIEKPTRQKMLWLLS